MVVRGALILLLCIVSIVYVHTYVTFNTKPSPGINVPSKSRTTSFESRAKKVTNRSSVTCVASSATDDDIITASEQSISKYKRGLDFEFLKIAGPAFISLTADPLASLVDAIYVGRLGVADQGGMGIAISSQYSVAKLYNDPLLKTSTSMVANKKGKELSASVTISIAIASIIGFAQCLIYVFFAGSILSAMSVPATSNMRQPALSYLRWRSLGVPAATILLVSNGIFRGRGDTKTPLYCTTLGNLINILLDPILIFNLKMGCAGAGAATAISQWVTVFPLLYFLNKSIPLRLSWEDRKELIQALKSYISAGGLVFIRTLGKVGAYTVTSAAAAKLGAVSMAAYSLTFNLGFATSQLCESISIAVQVLLARDMPIDNQRKQIAARHVIQRALILGLLVSSGLSVFTHFNLRNVLAKLTTSVDVQKTAAAIMPAVLLTQLIKGLTYSTGGIILGGLDWTWSTAGMLLASAVCVGLTRALPLTLTNIWLALAAFMGVQVIFSLLRVASSRGPWEGLIRKFSNDNTGEDTGSENIVKSAAM